MRLTGAWRGGTIPYETEAILLKSLLTKDASELGAMHWSRHDQVPGLGQSALQLAVILLLLASIAWLDFLSGPEVHLFVFYLLPILMVTSGYGQMAGIAMSLLCVACNVAVTREASPGLALPELATAAARLMMSVFVVVGWGRLQAIGRALAELSLTDALTGLQNRRACVLRGEAELARMRRSGECLSLMYIDLDNFKSVNDSLGHKGGDRVLRATGEALRGFMRRSDFAVRLGGDEFAVILPATDSAGGRRLGEEVRRHLRLLFIEQGVAVTASVGVATFHQAPGSFEEVLHFSDQLMYRAKSNGKDFVMQQDFEGASSSR